jgi:hypothetical protein
LADGAVRGNKYDPPLDTTMPWKWQLALLAFVFAGKVKDDFVE